MEKGQTTRGFDVIHFNDANGERCNMQISSAIDEEALLWLGIAHDKVRALEPGKGWQDVNLKALGRDVLVVNRMHLTQSMVKAMLPHLKKFAKTGEI